MRCLRRLTGRTTHALGRLESSAAAATTEDRTARSNNYLGRSQVHLAIGDLETAYQEAATALEAEPSGINSPSALAVEMHAALWLGDAARARLALDAMQAFRGRWMAATRLTAEAGMRVPGGPLRSGRGSVCTRTRGMARAGFAARSRHVRSGPRIGSRRGRPCRR